MSKFLLCSFVWSCLFWAVIALACQLVEGVSSAN